MCFPVNFVKFLRAPFLQNTSGRLLLLLNPIMNSDDTYLFYPHRSIKELFETANNEQRNLNDWCFENKI